ncbi:DEAD/DEAH box helicase, partial [Streptococcus thermophilus]
KNKKVLFFSHRKEINEQVIKTFKRGDVNLDNVTIGTVGSLVRKLDKLPNFDVILVDEAHHIKAKQYQTILTYFKDATQLFFTGTPIRLDGAGFHDLAEDLVEGKSVRWLQENGNISEFSYYSINLLDLDKLKTRSGEYTNQSIDEAFESSSSTYGDYIYHYKRLAEGKQAIVYVHTVEYAERVAERFNENGYSATVVSGKTPKKERAEAMERFRNGDLMIMVNVNLFTEGIDLPNVDVCIMLRPTQSLSLYLQFAMRALNPREGKRAILIDHVGNHIIHGLPNDYREWTLDGVKTNKNKSEKSTVTCDSCFAIFWRDQLIDGNCPYCGAVVVKKKEIKDIEKE